MVSFVIAMQIIHSCICYFNLMTPTVSAYISALDEGGPYIVNLYKVRALCNPYKPASWPQPHIVTVVYNTNMSEDRKKPGIVLNDKVTITTHTTNPMAQLCRVTLYNIRNIRPFQSKYSVHPSSCYFKTGLPQCPIGQPFSQREQSVCRWSRT